VFRTYPNGQVIVSRYPDMSDVVWSPAQVAHRQRVKQANLYAHAAMADPEVAAIYRKRAAEKDNRPYQLAVSDYFKGIDLLAEKKRAEQVACFSGYLPRSTCAEERQLLCLGREPAGSAFRTTRALLAHPGPPRASLWGWTAPLDSRLPSWRRARASPSPGQPSASTCRRVSRVRCALWCVNRARNDEEAPSSSRSALHLPIPESTLLRQPSKLRIITS